MRGGGRGVVRSVRGSTYPVDGLIALAVALPLTVPFLTGAPGRVTLLGGVLTAGTVLPLVWRRRAPFTVALTVALFAQLVALHHRPGQQLQYPLLVVAYTVAELGGRRQRTVFLAAVLLTGLPLSLLLQRGTALPEFLFTVLLPLTAFLLGTLSRANRERAGALAQRAAELERTRIARDLHDVLAHSISVMVVQAEAGPVSLPGDPDRAVRSFDTIAGTGRSAMSQLAHLLGVLTDDGDRGGRQPAAAVEAVPALLDQVRRAGLEVELSTTGTPRPLTAQASAAAYRIVQESLTNTLRHAGAGRARVRLEWAGDLAITVTDDGTAPAGADRPPGGHGLAGLRERAAACGGQLEAGPVAGGFRVAARLPAGAAPPAARP